eukprot:scaffold313700_cov30-Tisochrysis_lutea.AAC.1
MEGAGDVGRRQADRELRPLVLWSRVPLIVLGSLPPLVPRSFDLVWQIFLRHRCVHQLQLAAGRRVDVGAGDSARVLDGFVLLLLRRHSSACSRVRRGGREGGTGGGRRDGASGSASEATPSTTRSGPTSDFSCSACRVRTVKT